ncbi:hypothetical protein Ddye_032229 [Dipteronia dyeriana]|uniref:Reverse transcriptase zinc-binding domain-containing protein n=1 Tax=Dipteronia dyeriana TaxID=168575 RepID=A0AAD9TKG8_9ROSI|nr:hypothetical protein Ddye_032229 [Dipteronia dyeriana]
MVLSLSCVNLAVADSLMWHYEKMSSYSVKSDYHLGCKLASLLSSSGLNATESWRKYLWRIKIQAKVKLHIWKACFNRLPTNVNLAKRGLPVETQCSLRDKWPETTMHALWTCPATKKVYPCAESDAKGVVDLINDVATPCYEIGLVIIDIKLLLAGFPSCRVGFAPREANLVAHCLAKLGLAGVSDKVWLEDS